MYSPVLLLATPAIDVKSLADLMASAKSRPGAIRWSPSGPGSLGHIMLEQLQAAGKVQFTHVPYKGGGQQITDGLGGQFELMSVNAVPGPR